MPPTKGGIVRINHSKERPYFPVSRSLAQDARLTFAFRGLMTYLLSKPDGWTVRVNDLIRNNPKGRDHVRNLLAEGQKQGYIHRHRGHNPDTGQFAWITEVYEDPSLNPTIDGFTVDGLPVDGFTVDGFTVDGFTTDGKPAYIEYTDADYTELDNTEADKRESENTESRIDDDGWSLIHWFQKWGGCRGGGDLAALVRLYANWRMAELPDWDGGAAWLEDLDGQGVTLFLEWINHLDRNPRLWESLDNPIGFLRHGIEQGKRPGLTTAQGKKLVDHIIKTTEIEIEY